MRRSYVSLNLWPMVTCTVVVRKACAMQRSCSFGQLYLTKPSKRRRSSVTSWLGAAALYPRHGKRVELVRSGFEQPLLSLSGSRTTPPRGYKHKGHDNCQYLIAFDARSGFDINVWNSISVYNIVFFHLFVQYPVI